MATAVKQPATPTTNDKLQIVKQALAGHDWDYIVAANPHLTADQIAAVLDSAGGRGQRDPTTVQHTATLLTQTLQQEHSLPPAALPNAPITPTATDTVTDLLTAGHRSNAKRIQTLASKITTDLDKLRTALAAQDAKDRQKAAAEAARKAALAEVCRLEKELKQAKERLRNPTTAPPPSPPASTGNGQATTPPAMIRTWARDQGMACPTKGRIPTSIADAYRAAHP
jgi:hypothetical protein